MTCLSLFFFFLNNGLKLSFHSQYINTTLTHNFAIFDHLQEKGSGRICLDLNKWMKEKREDKAKKESWKPLTDVLKEKRSGGRLLSDKPHSFLWSRAVSPRRTVWCFHLNCRTETETFSCTSWELKQRVCCQITWHFKDTDVIIICRYLDSSNSHSQYNTTLCLKLHFL